tara:strand:- start:620 stop:808 length:189 start_codon:yes stop_codon:yes gene_type:complete
MYGFLGYILNMGNILSSEPEETKPIKKIPKRKKLACEKDIRKTNTESIVDLPKLPLNNNVKF